MKKLIAPLLVCFLFSALSAQAADQYTFDPAHSYILWHINHFGFSNPSGKWMANGTLFLDQKKPQNSKVNVTINMGELDTGNKELDKHLLSPEFFDSSKYPTATFVSDKVSVTSKKTARVHGILNLHGVSKPVTLNVILNKIGTNPITDKPTVGFTASTQLKRSDFDMTTFLPGLSDKVKIDIEAEAYKSS